MIDNVLQTGAPRATAGMQRYGSPPMMTPAIRDVRARGCQLQLAAVPEAVAAARRFVTATLQAWSVIQEVVETAELVTSELGTNAVERTMLAAKQDSDPRRVLGVWRVGVCSLGPRVLVEVWDADPAAPVLQEQSLDADHGRGLFLVASLSARWGHYRPRAGGKVVWAQIENGVMPR